MPIILKSSDVYGVKFLCILKGEYDQINIVYKMAFEVIGNDQLAQAAK